MLVCVFYTKSYILAYIKIRLYLIFLYFVLFSLSSFLTFSPIASSPCAHETTFVESLQVGNWSHNQHYEKVINNNTWKN